MSTKIPTLNQLKRGHTISEAVTENLRTVLNEMRELSDRGSVESTLQIVNIYLCSVVRKSTSRPERPSIVYIEVVANSQSLSSGNITHTLDTAKLLRERSHQELHLVLKSIESPDIKALVLGFDFCVKIEENLGERTHNIIERCPCSNNVLHPLT